MFGKGKLLLVGICFTVFCSKVTVGNVLLDVASDAIDDQYNGCKKEAKETFIDSGLLQKELNASKGFQKAWNKNARCSTLIPGGLREHTAALSVFLDGDVAFIHELNNAVETLGVNRTTYENNFHFKSLHFLLMDSMVLLKPDECKTVYVLPDKRPTIPTIGSAVRFSGFTVAEPDMESFPDFADEVLFKIKSCYFVNLGEHTCRNDIDSVLIFPAEVFTVKKIGPQKYDGDEYTEIALEHLALNSTHNCYMFLRSTSPQHNQAPVLLPVVPLLGLLALWPLFI